MLKQKERGFKDDNLVTDVLEKILTLIRMDYLQISIKIPFIQ